jgi:type I restriction enzyme S subunit
MSKTADFVDLCQAASEGTTNRVRLKEDRFLRMKIPLPPLAEQKRIVAKLDALAGKIGETLSLRQKADSGLDVLVHRTRADMDGPLGSQEPLSGLLVSHDSGWSPQCSDSPAVSGEWAVLKTTSVQWRGFDCTQNKALLPGQWPRSDIVVGDGDVLVTRAGPVNRVGVACVVRGVPGKLMLSDKIVRLKPRPSVLPAYLAVALSTPSAQEHFRQNKTGLAASQVNIARSNLLSLRITVPPLAEQRCIVAYLDGLQAKVDALKELQAQAAAELDALLPSILNQAFKGEL